jgi:hypothetical protein
MIPGGFIVKKSMAAMLVFAMFASICSAADYLSTANYFGTFTTEQQDGKAGCAAVDSTAVAIRMPVHVIVLSTPQRALTGIVKSRSSAECTRYFQSSESAAFYEIRVTQGRFDATELGVIVLPPLTLTQTKKGGVMVKLGGEDFQAYECASNEGIHVIVRSVREPSRVVWHDYLYLGYDVDPTCTRKDYDGIERLGKAIDSRAQIRGR